MNMTKTQFNDLLGKYAKYKTQPSYSEFSELFPAVEVDDSNSVQLVPVNESVELDEGAKLFLVNSLFTGSWKLKLSLELDHFSVIVHVDSNNTLTTNVIAKSFHSEELTMNEQSIRQGFRTAMRNVYCGICEEISRNAVYLRTGLQGYERRHGDTEVIKSRSHGRCQFVLTALYREFEPEDYTSEERLLRALEAIAENTGELFTLNYELLWNNETIYYTSMEGYIRLFTDDVAVKAFSDSILRMAKEVFFISRYKLIETDQLKSPQVKEAERLFGAMNLGILH